MNFAQEKNPYTLQFAIVPPRYVGRAAICEEIISDLVRELPTFRCQFISGVRGAGKTVLMTDIAGKIEKEKDWITVDIANPESNIIASLAKALYRKPELKALFLKAKIDLSVVGFSISMEKADTVAVDEEDAADIMLAELKKRGKKVLVTIDEATYGKEVASFSHILSSYARKGYDIYVLMTGLPDNIREIKNNKALTFLYRAKENELGPLNKLSIINDYKSVFNISEKEADEMAELTRGYAFAFQALGFLYWKALAQNPKALLDDILGEFDYYLSDFSYEKIWAELTPKEKEILKAIAQLKGKGEAAEIRALCNMDTNKYSVYRERLIMKDLVNGSEYGKLSFSLPRFSSFVNNQWK